MRIFPFASLLLATTLGAQPRAPQWEMRADGYSTGAIFGGVGFVVPVGTYARLGLAAAGGRYLDEPRVETGRLDALARFHFDPLRQSRRGPYAAGGLSLLRRQDGDWRPYLMVRIGLEGAPRGGWLPAAELGLGGGPHVAVVLRRARGIGR